MKKAALVEQLHFVGNNPWVLYSLLDEPIADYPDNGNSVVLEVVGLIRARCMVGLSEAYVIWRGREVRA